jgi:trehalose 6-phosphate phosphatase
MMKAVMKPILKGGEATDLHQFIGRGKKTLFAFDFDGTLVEIADSPEKVVLKQETAIALTRLSCLAPVAIISGRSKQDLLSRSRDALVPYLIGNHGSDWEAWERSHPVWSSTVSVWKETVTPKLKEIPGVMLEDKRLSLSIHFRQALDPIYARRMILTHSSGLPGARVVEGKCVVNLVPETAPHKGDALRELLRLSGCQQAVFVGDDITDEDAFSFMQGPSFLSIRVGEDPRSLARYYVDGQEDAGMLLKSIIMALEADREGE